MKKDYRKNSQGSYITNFFEERLNNFLTSINFSGDIGKQEIIVIDKKTTFKIRRPDFICYKYGFVIELDSNEDWPDKYDAFEDYKKLDLVCFSIKYYQIDDPDSLNRFMSDIKIYIEQSKLDVNRQKKYGKRRARLSRARKKFRLTNIDIIGTSKPLLKKFGGFRNQFRN